MARDLRTSPLAITCAVCDSQWEITHKGRLPKVCPECSADFQWCSRCEVAKPKADFHASTKSGRACKQCVARLHTFSCDRCGESFRRKHPGGRRRVHLCDSCEQTHKGCTGCESIKPRAEFSKAKDKRDGLVAQCRSCRSRANALPEARKARVVRKYGITSAEWDAFYLTQGGLCACCGQPPAPESRGLVIDHDHATGEIRALLCSHCNIGLGHFFDSPDLLRRAADYLEACAKVGE